MDAKWQMAGAMGLAGTIGLVVLGSGAAPLTVVLWRCLIGGATLLAWVAWRGQWRAPGRGALLLTLLGAATLVGNWLCLFTAYRLSSVSVATLVYHVQPFFLVLLAALLQRQMPRWGQLGWLGLAFVGVGLTSGIDLRTASPDMLAGAGLALLAALLYGVTTLVTRKLAAFTPAQVAGMQLLAGAVVLAPLAGWEVANWSTLASLLTLGLVHTALMYALMYAAFQRLPTDTIANLSFIYPLVAIVIDLLVFDIALDRLQLLGMATILFAVLANQGAWRWSGALRLFHPRAKKC